MAWPGIYPGHSTLGRGPRRRVAFHDRGCSQVDRRHLPTTLRTSACMSAITLDPCAIRATGHPCSPWTRGPNPHARHEQRARNTGRGDSGPVSRPSLSPSAIHQRPIIANCRARPKFAGEGSQDGAWVSRPSGSRGSPQANNQTGNHGMHADGLRPTSTLAWLVHAALPALALRPTDGRADQARCEEG